MTCVDIIFPLNLGPLTYRCPAEWEGSAEPGMIVSAQLKRSITRGVILRKNSSPPSGTLKHIVAIHGDAPLFSRGMLKLIAWMADYYLAPEGLILKQAFPKELFTTAMRSRTSGRNPDCRLVLDPIAAEELATIVPLTSVIGYQTYLIQTASSLHEYSVVAALLTSAKNALVILPEISQADIFLPAIAADVGERACLFHSGMPAGRRSETIQGIVAGRHDIVVGTRAALFSPMKKPSVIMVLHEHASSYKCEEGIRFNVRDTAVMKGFIEKIPVLLFSTVPSLESWHNAHSGKYKRITLHSAAQRPGISVVDMRYSKKVKPYLSRSAVDAAGRIIRKTGRIMFVVNRRGHATMLLCAECGRVEKCENCGIPLVFHKDRNLLQCHYCATVRPVPAVCMTCGSPELELIGAGTQRIEEDIEEIFGVRPLRFDSDRAKRPSQIRALTTEASSAAAQIVVGTKLMTRRISPFSSFSLAAILTADNSLNIPDFRARERTYQELTDILDLVEPAGRVIVQTRLPQDTLFAYYRNNAYDAFAAEELMLRKALQFPPYARLLNILIHGSRHAAGQILRTIQDSFSNIEVLGPLERRTASGGTEYSILLKSQNRKALHAAARTALTNCRNLKNVTIKIDVDPS